MYNVLAVFSAVDNISGVMATIGGNAQTLSGRLTTIGQSMMGTGTQLTMGLTVPILAAGAAVMKLGSDFETSMTVARTMTGSSAAQFELYKSSIEELRKVLPQSMDEMAQGLYFVASAGFRGQEAIDILTASGKAAAVSLADIDTVARSVVSVLSAYGMEGSEAGRITDILTMGVIEGTAEFEEIAGSIGRVLPIAAQAGVSFEQIMASLATMTRAGLTADEATTALRASLMNMYAPSKEAAKTLGELGLSADEVRTSIAEKGLLATLAMLMDVTGGNVETLDKLFGNVRGLVGVLATAGSQSEAYAEILGKVQNSLGVTDQAFATTAETARVKTALFRNALEAFGITISNILLPPLMTFLDQARAWIDRLGELDPKTLELGIKIAGLAAAIGPVLIVLGALVTGLGALLSPVGLVVAAVVGFGVAIATNFGGLRDTLGPLIEWFGDIFRALAEDLRTNSPAEIISEWAPRVVPILRETIEYILRHVSEGATSLANGLAEWAQAFGNWLGSPQVVAIGRQVDGLVSDIVSWIRTNAPQIAAGLQQWAQEWVDYLKPYVPQVVAAGKDVLSKITAWIATTASDVGKALDNWAQEWSNYLVPKIPAIVAGGADALRQILSWIVSRAVDIGKALVEWAQEWVDYLKPYIPRVVDAAQDLLAKIVSWVKDKAGDIADALKKWASEWVDFLKPILPTIPGKILEFVQKVVSGIQSGVPKVSAGLLELATKFVTWLTPKVPELLTELAGFLTKIVLWIGTAAVALGLELVKFAAAFLKGVIPASVDLLRALVDFIDVITKWVVSDAVPAITTAVEDWAEAMWSFVQPAVKQATEKLDEIKGAITGWVDERLEDIREKWQEIGSSLLEGIGIGIDNMKKWLLEKLGVIIHLLPASVREWLEAESPSQIFIEIGKDIMIGLAEGIDQEKLDVIEALTGAIDGIISNARSIIDSLSERLPTPRTTIADILTRAFGITQETADFLSQPGIQEMIDWFAENFQEPLEAWAEALEPLDSLLGTIKSLLELTSEDFGEVKLDVEEVFRQIDQLMVTVANLVWDVKDKLAANAAAFRDEIAPLLADWNEAIGPLSDLLGTMQGLLETAGGEFGEVKLDVEEVFRQIDQLMVTVANLVWDVKDKLATNVAAFRDEIAPLLADWNEAIGPLSDLLSTAQGILEVAAEETAEVNMKVEKFFDNLKQVLNEVEFWVEDHRSAIGNFIVSWGPAGGIGKLFTDWNTAIAPLSELLGTAQGILEVAAEETAEVNMKVKTFFDNLTTVLRDVETWVNANRTAISGFITAWGGTSGIGKLLGDWNTAIAPLQGLLSTAQGILETLAGDMVEVKGKASAFLGSLLGVTQEVQTWMSTNGGTLSGLVVAFRDKINPALTGWKDQLGPLRLLVTDAKGLFDLLNTDMGDVSGKARSFLDAIWGMISGVQQWFSDHPTYATDLVGMVNNVKPNITALNTAAKLLRSEFTDTVYYLGELSAQAGEAKRLADLFVSALAWSSGTSSTSFGSGITTAIASANSALKSGLGTLTDTVNNAIYRMQLELPSALSDLAGDLGGAITAVLTDVVNSATIPSTTWIGQEIISGIEVGMWSRADDLNSALNDIIYEALQQAKITAGIASPSKMFMAIGRDIALGMAYGIAGATPEVTSAVNGMVGGLDYAANVRGVSGVAARGAVTNEMHLHVGVLVADEAGLKELERRLRPVREQEDERRGL